MGPPAFDWLQRGLKTSLLDFIAGAKKGESLHVCIYEFFDKEIGQALKAAKNRGVEIDIVYHAKPKDHATEKSEKVLEVRGF